VARGYGAPLEVLNAAFSSEFDRARIVPGDGVFYVVKVVEEVAPKINNAKKKEIEAEVKAMFARQILDDYTGFLGRKYSIAPNEKMLRRLLGNQ